MGPDTLDTLDAIMAGLHTLNAHAESVADEQLRARLTGAIVGLRAAVLTARDQVTQMQAHIGKLQAGTRASIAPRMKWGCYQFDDAEGLFCARCWDARQRRIRTMPYNPGNLVCPNCRALFPIK